MKKAKMFAMPTRLCSHKFKKNKVPNKNAIEGVLGARMCLKKIIINK